MENVIIGMLALSLSSTSLASLITGQMPCKPILEIATAYANKMHGHALRELDAQQVTQFNSRPPETDWAQVWLMDIEGGGMIFAGPGEDKSCYVGVLNSRDWHNAIDDLERKT